MEDYSTMSESQWKSLYPFFTPDECGSTNMNWEFMQKCYRLRTLIGSMKVHCAFDMDGHAPKSYHYTGQAMDFSCDTNYRLIMAAIDHVGFGGVGWYPHWNNKGFHIDNRPDELYQRWISPAKNEYEYLLRMK